MWVGRLPYYVKEYNAIRHYVCNNYATLLYMYINVYFIDLV